MIIRKTEDEIAKIAEAGEVVARCLAMLRSKCRPGVTTAEVTDRQGALQAIERCQATLGRVWSVLADSGYVGQPFAQAVQETIGATVQIARRSELHCYGLSSKSRDVGEIPPLEHCSRSDKEF